jgi:hypothetical protein
MAMFKPEYNEAGELLNFQKFECLKKYCYTTRQSKNEGSAAELDPRQIIFPRHLYRLLKPTSDRQGGVSNYADKLFAFCINHFSPQFREDIAKGTLIPQEEHINGYTATRRKYEIRSKVLKPWYQTTLNSLMLTMVETEQNSQNDIAADREEELLLLQQDPLASPLENERSSVSRRVTTRGLRCDTNQSETSLEQLGGLIYQGLSGAEAPCKAANAIPGCSNQSDIYKDFSSYNTYLNPNSCSNKFQDSGDLNDQMLAFLNSASVDVNVAADMQCLQSTNSSAINKGKQLAYFSGYGLL